LRARGGLTVDIGWRDGRLVAATIRGEPGRSLRIAYGDTVANLTVPASGSLTWNGRAESL
jgi:alpha-L-fucosidase 2